MGVPYLMGPGFSPKLTLDLLDDMSYLVIILHNKFVEERYDRTPWFDRTTRNFSNQTKELQTVTFEGLLVSLF
jgi:hypothetical protein